jgi:hypothetical protein
LLATFLTLCLLASVLCPSAHATELTDLGENLSYLRVQTIDDSAKGLTAALRERDALVLDLRHVTTTADSAQLLLTALKTRALKQPVYILIGPATPSSLAALLTASTNKFITLGVKESIPLPRVIIDQSAATDLRAFEALDAGQPIATLISGKIGKDRFDEAALMKEFNNGNINAAPPAVSTAERPATPDPTGKPTVPEKKSAPTAKADDKAAAKPDEVLTDRVLQRAVHLHRAQIALRR